MRFSEQRKLESECINSIVDMRMMVEKHNINDKGLNFILDHASDHLKFAIQDCDEQVLQYVAQTISHINTHIRSLVNLDEG